jgi:hypothetical protein
LVRSARSQKNSVTISLIRLSLQGNSFKRSLFSYLYCQSKFKHKT